MKKNEEKITDEFEREYFQGVYSGVYGKRNPPYKLRSFLNRLLLFKKKGRLLDVGCAYGLFLGLASQHFECEGIDISKYAISIAKNNLSKDVKLHAQSVEKIRLSKKFDVITCFDILEHLSDLDKVLEKVKGWLKADGILVVTVPVYDGFVGKLVELADKDDTHLQKKSRKFWLKILKKHGFKIVMYSGIFRYFLLSQVYLNWVSDSIRRFSPAIFIIARK